MADKTQKDKNKEAISNINKTGTVSGQKSGVTGSNNVVRTNVDETNLAGVNYGSTRSTPTSSGPTGINTQSYNLAGTNNIANAGGTVRNNTTTNQGPYVSSSTNKKYVTGNDPAKYQSTLSSMADSSTKKANQILNTLGSTFKSIADLGKANQDYQNGLRQERLEIGRERSYAKADKDRADLTNSITQEDFDQFYNLDGSEVDFDGKIKDLTSKKSTLENIVNTATNEGQKNSAQAELDEVLAQIENFNLLKQKREALSETYTLESLKSEGDEQGYRSYRDMFSHKNDNLLQRAGSAVSHLAVETANEVPTMVDQFVYKAKATAVQQNLDLINQAYENKEIDIDQYVKALADIDERIKQAQDEYSDSTSMMIRDVVNQYGANTYYGANDIEKVLLQVGESTAQFLLHYVIGKGIASVAYKDKALIEAGKNFVLENYGENVLAGLTDPDLLSYGVSALGGDIATISMSGVGMTEKINQLLDEGYDINTAYMNGLFTGLVSYATEKVGMDELVKTFGTKVSADILGKVIRSSVVSGFMAEGGEEFVEGLIDPFIDTVTLGTDYKVNGNELLMAFMLGGFSGGAMAGGSVAINYATEAVNVNRALKARTQNRATVNTLNRVGRLIIENRGEYNATKAEMDLLERNYSSMTEYQKEVYEGIKKFYEDGRRNYEAMSQTMGVEFADDQVSLSSPEENDHTVIQTLESDFNQEAQMINTLDELQEDVNSKLDPIIDAELSVRNKTQQLLNDSGYNMDADLFNSLDSNLQNEALVALDFAKIKGLDVNITDDAGIKEILLNNSSKVQNFAKTHSEEETNALLQNIVDGTNGLRVGEGIAINANKNPVLSTLVHELTHGTESSALYDVLKDVVSNAMDNWDATVENKAQIYDNVQDFKNAEERRLNAEQEVVAETVEKNLGNEKFLNDLIRYDYSAFSRLWQNIKSLGDSSETTRIKNAFEKAFRDNYGQGDMRYSVSEALIPEQLKADTDYMKAVDDGDMGKAKRLVKETARKNGYTVDVYHGTYNFGRTKFTDFGGALFLTDDPSVARNFSGDQPVRDIVGSFDANKDSIEDVVNYVKQNTWADNIREAKLSDFDQEIERVKPNKSDIKKYGQEFYDRWAKNYEIAKKNKERFLKGEPFFYMRSNSFAYDYPNDPIISEERVREFAEENNFKNTKNGESNGGVYQMYLRPENMLEIEVGGNYYTDVPIPKELREYARPEELERGYATSDQILRMASDAGYGTIKYANMREGGDWGNAGVSNVYVSLDAPRNVKSADPVVYDDNGNVISLSERFDPNNDDIRYSYDPDNLIKKATKELSMDTEYMDAVNSGDMETAQRLVDEVAKENGYGIKAYHGTNAKFTVFDKQKAGKNFNNYLHFGTGFYFAPTAEATKQYGKNTMSVYLSAERLLDVSKPVQNEKAYQYLVDNGMHPGDARYAMNYGDRFINVLYDILLEDYSQGGANDQVQSLLREFGYDGVVGFYGANNDQGQIVVFDPSQVKSADPVTYDDNGNVIPLSERFNPESNDIRYSYNKEEADKISKEDKDLIKRATKELSTVKDSTRKANTKAEVVQALNEVNETGDISNTTLGRLRQKVIESTLTRVPNDNYEIAKIIRQEMGWSSLPKKNWDVVLQTINDRFSIIPDGQYPSGYQDAKELVDNYLADVGGKYNYLSPVEQGWITAEEYERTIDDAIKNATDILKYGSTEQDIASSIINEVSDYLDGTDEFMERLAEQAGYESVQNVQDENDSVPLEELTALSEYGNIEERNRHEFRILQEIGQDLLRKSGRDGVWDSEERYRLLENAGVRKRVSEILRAELESRGYSDSNPNGLLEDTGNYKIYKDVDGQTFHDIFSIAQLYTPLGELVDVHPADTVKHDGWTELGYKETRNFISEDGMSGFAIEPDDNLISVFNASDKSGFLKSIAPFVRENASKCDCYVLDPKYTGTNLPKMYNAIFGFEVDHIEEYNVEEYGDEKGIARRYENPPIAYMVNPKFTATQENQTDGDLNLTDEDLKNYRVIGSATTEKYGKKNIDKETGIFKPKAIIELESTIGKTTHEEEIKDGEEYAGKFAQELDNGADVDDLLQKMMSNELQNGIVRAYYVSQVLADRDMQSEYMELAQWARDIGNLGGKLVESNKILYDLDSTFSKAVYLTQVEENLKSEYKEHLKNKKGVDVEQTISEIFNEYANKIINSKTSREFRSAIGALTREVNRRMPKTIWDRIHQYRMLAMLSGTKTAVANFASNTFSLGLYRMNSMNQALLESAMQNVEIKSFDDKKAYRINQEDRNATLRKDSTATKRNRKLATEIWDSLGENEKTKYGIETEKIPDIIKNNLKIKNETTQSKLSKAVGGLFDTVQNVQGVLLNDAPFAKVAFVQKFDELARARGINTEKINKSSKEYARLIDDAYNYAQEVVSHNDTDISKTIANLTRKSASNVRINEDSTLVGLDKQIKRFKERANNGEPIYRFIDSAVSKLQKWFIPFYKTNASLLQKSLQFSPLEWGQVINDWGKVKAGRMEVVDMVEHMSKAVTGTELYLVGAIFGFLGLLKWEKDDEDYSGRLSIKIPGTDKGYTVDFIDPISTIFAKGVVLAQNVSEQGGPFKTIEGLVRDYEDIFLSDELDMFSSMKGFFDTVGKVRKGKDDYGEYTLGDGATDIAFSVLNSYIPSIVRDVSRMIDPAKKNVYDTDNKKYLFNRLVNSTPFRTNLVDKKDATGRTINYTQPFTGNDVFDRILTQMVSRGKLVDSNGQAITTRSGSQNMQATSSDGYAQMAKDFQYKDENGDGFSDAHWIRDSVPSSIYPAGVQTELTPKEKETYGKTWTDTWTSGANYLADNDIYKGLSYENQADVVYELQGFARECIEADYCMANNLEMTEAQRTANEIRNFCTVNGKLDGKMLGLIALGTAKENKLASGGQRYVMAEQDEEGKTIRNSRQLAMRHIYEEAGIYDKIVEAVQNSNGALTYADFGLGKTVVEKYSDEKAGSDYQTIYNKNMKSSSKKSSKVSGGSAGGITKAKGGGSTKKLSMAPNPIKETKVANSYLKAYADVFKRNSSKATSSSGGTVICPKCGNRVSSGLSRCPICGTSL